MTEGPRLSAFALHGDEVFRAISKSTVFYAQLRTSPADGKHWKR